MKAGERETSTVWRKRGRLTLSHIASPRPCRSVFTGCRPTCPMPTLRWATPHRPAAWICGRSCKQTGQLCLSHCRPRAQLGCSQSSRALALVSPLNAVTPSLEELRPLVESHGACARVPCSPSAPALTRGGWGGGGGGPLIASTVLLDLRGAPGGVGCPIAASSRVSMGFLASMGEPRRRGAAEQGQSVATYICVWMGG